MTPVSGTQTLHDLTLQTLLKIPSTITNYASKKFSHKDDILPLTNIALIALYKIAKNKGPSATRPSVPQTDISQKHQLTAHVLLHPPRLKRDIKNNSITSIVTYFDTMANKLYSKQKNDSDRSRSRRRTTSLSSSATCSSSPSPTSKARRDRAERDRVQRPILPKPPSASPFPPAPSKKNAYQATEEKLRLGKVPKIRAPPRPKPDPGTPTYGEHRRSRIGKNTSTSNVAKITDYFQSISPPNSTDMTNNNCRDPRLNRPPRSTATTRSPATATTTTPVTTTLNADVRPGWRIGPPAPLLEARHPNQAGIDSCQKMIDKTNLTLADLYSQKTDLMSQMKCIPDAGAIIKQQWKGKMSFLDSSIAVL